MHWLFVVGTIPAQASDEVAAHTAHILRPGEVMLGTSGAHLGVFERVQLSTRPFVTVLGLYNAGIKIQPVHHEVFDLSLHAYGLQSWLDGWDLRAGGFGATTSVSVQRASFHFGATSAGIESHGLPETAPTWLKDLYGEEPVAALADRATTFGCHPNLDAVG